MFANNALPSEPVYEQFLHEVARTPGLEWYSRKDHSNYLTSQRRRLRMLDQPPVYPSSPAVEPSSASPQNAPDHRLRVPCAMELEDDAHATAPPPVGSTEIDADEVARVCGRLLYEHPAIVTQLRADANPDIQHIVQWADATGLSPGYVCEVWLALRAREFVASDSPHSLVPFPSVRVDHPENRPVERRAAPAVGVADPTYGYLQTPGHQEPFAMHDVHGENTDESWSGYPWSYDTCATSESPTFSNLSSAY